MSSFVHLRARSEHSVVDGTLPVGELISLAAKNSMPACALTDSGGMFGAIRFYEAARAKGVKPLIGVDVLVEEPLPADAPEGAQPPSFRILLLCQNLAGYRRLMELVSRSYLENQKLGSPRVKLEWLQENAQGLIALSGDEATGSVGSLLAAGDSAGAKARAQTLSAIFPERFFIELQRRGQESETKYIQSSVELAHELGLPPVATHPVQFAQKSDYLAHEVKTCVFQARILQDRQRPRLFTNEQYFKTGPEMEELFADIPEALANASTIAQSCSLEIPLNHSHLPDFPTPDGSPLAAFFAEESRKGLEARLDLLFPDAGVRAAKAPLYKERLEQEIAMIIKMGFPGYFMIVSDFIRWAKEHDIPVGPGRGSGAGSIVAYSLQITDVDPIRHDLLFERFLNPDRVSMPDFDIDFCSKKRGLVIDYVKRKYGEQAVSQISTVTSMAAKAAIRDVGRVMDMNYTFVDGVSKMIPQRPGEHVTLKGVLESEPALKERYDTDKKVKKLFDVAMQIEGLTRSIGRHAGGVLIAPGKVSDFSPLYAAEGSADIVSQYDKDDVEKAGLVKFDFLAVSVLTVLDRAVELIRKQAGQEKFSLTTVPMDDPAAYALYSTGNAFGLFQMENDGMRQTAVKMGISDIEALTDLLALYRPGPLGSGMVDDYIARKKGEEPVEYPHPLLEDLLRPTQGVIVYQEQVMQIARTVAGYTLGGADLLRRAMGKKKPEEMAKQKQVFIDGCAKNNVDAKVADSLFSLIEKFAEYGFNKSHSCAYAYLSYHSAYLKAKFPSEFYAAAMTTEAFEQADSDKISALYRDAKRNGITVRAPNINLSGAAFEPLPAEKSVLYGLAAIKGLGVNAAEQILLERQANGPFASLVDFTKRCRGHVKKNGVEALIKAGAFDSISSNRAALLAHLPQAMEYAKKLLEQNEEPASPLDELELVLTNKKAKKRTKKASAPLQEPILAEAPEQSMIEQLVFEKQSLGYYLGGHPFEAFSKELGGLPGCLPLDKIEEQGPGYDQHWIGGVISNVKTIMPKSGKGKMAFVSFSDGENTKEITVFSNIYAEHQEWLKEGSFALFSAKIQDRAQGLSLLADDILDLCRAKALMSEGVDVAVPLEKFSRLREIASAHAGETPVWVWHPVPSAKDGAPGYARSSEPALRIGLSDSILDEMRREFGAKFVKVKFKKNIPAPVVQAKPKKAWGSRDMKRR